MTRDQKDSLAELRAVLETRAESISASVQMMLTGGHVANDKTRADLKRMLESAQEMYRLVRKELTRSRFSAVSDSFEDWMQLNRHELRGLLNTVVGRAQLIQFEEDLSPAVRDEVDRVLSAARLCVDALNDMRDGTNGHLADIVTREDRDAVDGVEITQEGSVPVSSPATILVVDDKMDSRKQLQRFLEHCGHTVHLAEDGAAALSFLTANEVDLILLDLHMPGLNGFQVIERLREMDIMRSTPVIIVSGMDFGTHAVRGIEMGAEDYIARPIDLSLLRARVNSALERQRLRERELAQFFTPGLARALLRHPEDLRVGRSEEISVLFVDVVGFSRVSERVGPEGTINWLGNAMEAFSDCILEHEGVLVDYTGDQIMAVWGAPKRQPNHATLACQAALGLWNCLPEINRKWQPIIGESTEISIGINTGVAFVGNVGTKRKFKYGALGNTVNLASRLQCATKYVHSRVIISGETRAQLRESLLCRRLAQLQVNNIAQPVTVHELATAPDENRAQLYSEYEGALNHFESGELHQACASLGDILKRFPDDSPSLNLLSRTVKALLRKDVPHDPLWVLSEK